jgi:hypothetical protein
MSPAVHTILKSFELFSTVTEMDHDWVVCKLWIDGLASVFQPLDCDGRRDLRKLGFHGLQLSQEVLQKTLPLGIFLTCRPLISDTVDEQPKHGFGI